MVTRFQFVVISALIHLLLLYCAGIYIQSQGQPSLAANDFSVDYLLARNETTVSMLAKTNATALSTPQAVTPEQAVKAVTLEQNKLRDVVIVDNENLNEMSLSDQELAVDERISGLQQASPVQSDPVAEAPADPSLAVLESGYRDDLQKAIERHKYYPLKSRRRGEEGEVEVSFSILKDGAITGIQIARSSGYDSLDRASYNTLERLSRFKPIPQQLGRESWDFSVPVSYKLN